MVQSGKTASMIALMGLANASGYNLFIVLCGGKNSLRNQTQERVNDAFGLGPWGDNNMGFNINSLTKKNQDYSESVDSLNSGEDVFRAFRGKSIIVCIKKEINQLKKLRSHLGDLKEGVTPQAREQFKGFKSLIIDDEADYASQNTGGNDRSAINRELGKIRSLLHHNCYVAYTATPQACIAASHKNLIGYPNSFIWLLDPFRDKFGNTTSYLGLKEFFDEVYSSDLVKIIKDESWPHWKKDDPENQGIYTSEGKISEKKLVDAEKKYLTDCIKTEKENNCFVKAIVDFIISGSFKWLDHIKKRGLDNSWRSLNKINQQLPKEHPESDKNFPYHAMMFNLSYINKNQKLLAKLIEIQLGHVEKDFGVFENNGKDKYFSELLDAQKKKSERWKKPSKDYKKDEVVDLMRIFIDLVKKNISGKDDHIYVLNSSDDGDSLSYSEHDDNRTKKAAIVLGGHILSRGLTVDGLSTSFFVRSQSMSLGDTNLQMCRWFGHKKPRIHYQSLYVQKHSQDLFKSIADIDYRLRYNFSLFIMEDVPAKCMLLSLKSSQFFRATSPAKAKELGKGVMSSYSGKTTHCNDMFRHHDFMKNSDVLLSYKEKFIKDRTEKKWQQSRANVFYDVAYGSVTSLFKELHFDDDCLNVSPKNFLFFLKEWASDKFPEIFPKINIAFFGYDEKWGYQKIERKRDGTKGCETKKEAKEKALEKISNLISSQERKNYLGDAYIDRDEQWIKNHKNKNTEEKRRKRGDEILIIFWVLNGNYLCKNEAGKKFYLEEDESGFLEEPLVSFSVIVPPGGPYYKTETNQAKKDEVLMHPECKDILDKLPLL